MPALTLHQAFALATQHHHAGRLQQAEELYRQILAQQPQHADALHHLGIIHHQSGRHLQAIDLIRQAIALRPDSAEAHNNLGTALRSQGQLDDAIAAYRQAIALQPISAGAHYNLGIALQEKGQLDDAIAAYRQAIALRPKFPQAYNNLGDALTQSGQIDDAIEACRQSLALQPSAPESHNNLASALIAKGLFDQALPAARQALALRPDFPQALNNLGIALQNQGQLDDAIVAYRQALALQPDFPQALNSLAIALQTQGQLDDAVAAYRQALALRPSDPQTQINLGIALSDLGQLDQAIDAFSQAVALAPDHAKAHSHLGLALLRRGDLPAGWPEYEWRWKVRNFPPAARVLPQPLWNASPLSGRTLLLHAEQGIGDTIQFIRYLPQVAAYGDKILVEVQPELILLLRQLPGAEQWIARGEDLPDFDVQFPLQSLPHLFQTTLQTIPPPAALTPDDSLAQSWRRRLQPHADQLKIGLAWAGNPRHPNDRHRSLPLAILGDLAAVPGVQFYSLQKGPAAAQIRDLPQLRLIDYTADLYDFADTAALLSQLDLIISVDSAIIHLAGALSKPVWVLLPFNADWRWLLQRQDSPWYPTLRLFRQPTFGDWPAVVRQVAKSLATFAII